MCKARSNRLGMKKIRHMMKSHITPTAGIYVNTVISVMMDIGK